MLTEKAPGRRGTGVACDLGAGGTLTPGLLLGPQCGHHVSWQLGQTSADLLRSGFGVRASHGCNLPFRRMTVSRQPGSEDSSRVCAALTVLLLWGADSSELALAQPVSCRGSTAARHAFTRRHTPHRLQGSPRPPLHFCRAFSTAACGASPCGRCLLQWNLIYFEFE